MATAIEWRERVAQWKASGLSAAKFETTSGFPEKQLHQWAYRLKMTGPKASAVGKAGGGIRFLPIQRRPVSSATPIASGGVSGIRLSVDDTSVEVAIGFDESTLRRVLSVVKMSTRSAQ